MTLQVTHMIIEFSQTCEEYEKKKSRKVLVSPLKKGVIERT